MPCANHFIAKPGVKIATCPLVENGAMGVMSSPNYRRRSTPYVQSVRERLRQACLELDHEVRPDDASVREEEHFNFTRVQGHNQTTDR